MNSDDLIPQLVVHVDKSLVSEDASIVDNDVEPTKGMDSSFHYCITIFSGSLVAHSLSAILLDLLDYIIRVD